MPLRLELFNVLFIMEFHLFHTLVEHARVYSLPRSPHISIVVYSLYGQFQTQILILLSKIRAISLTISLRFLLVVKDR